MLESPWDRRGVALGLPWSRRVQKIRKNDLF
jgi:hypothetical protein